MENQHSVLLVDDEEANRLLITRRLQQEGYLVTVAENGRKGLELWHGSKTACFGYQ